MKYALPLLAIAEATVYSGFGTSMAKRSLLVKRTGGEGTYYTPGLGSCGIVSHSGEAVCAMNAPDYGVYANPNTAAWCGKCIMVTGPKGSMKFKVLDRCPVCKSGDIDMSDGHFAKVADVSAGRVPISWYETPCDGPAQPAPPKYTPPVAAVVATTASTAAPASSVAAVVTSAAPAPTTTAAPAPYTTESVAPTSSVVVAPESPAYNASVAPVVASPVYSKEQVAPIATAAPTQEKCIPAAVVEPTAVPTGGYGSDQVAPATAQPESPQPAYLQSGASSIVGSVVGVVVAGIALLI